MVQYVKLPAVFSEADAARLETVMALATCPDPNLAEVREEVLAKMCKENPQYLALIEEYRREVGQ